MMEYKGYLGEFSFDDKTHIFFGKVSNVKDSITFEGKSIQTLRSALQEAVDDYLAWCLKHGKSPEIPSKNNSESIQDQNSS